MPVITIATFKGEIPSYADNLLPDSAASIALNCHFDDGVLNPIEVNLDTLETVPVSTSVIFRYEDQYWFSFPDYVDVMRSPIARDPYKRVYWTDGVYPKVTYNTTFNGAARLPAASYQLGIPAPDYAPLVTKFTEPLDQDSTVTVYYVSTFVTETGEEGPPSDVSASIDCAPIGVELTPDTVRSLTVTYEGSALKIVTTDGTVVTDMNHVKNVNAQGVGTSTLTWLEAAPATGNSLSVSSSQMDNVGVRSETAEDVIVVGDTASETVTPVVVTGAPIVVIESDTNNDSVIVPSEINNGTITVSVTFDDQMLVDGGYVSIYIVNGGDLGTEESEIGEVELSIQPPGLNRSNITRIRIYRTVTGSGVTEFLRVADLPISQATYLDSTADGQAGAILDTETFTMPPEEMQGLCSMANGISAGFVDNQVLFSEVYLPYAWPEEYRFSIEYDIVAIEPIGTSLVVGTTGDPYLYTGISPGNIAGQKLEIAQACVSRRSMVNIGAAVIYACPDGLVAIAPDGVRMATDNIIKPMQWRKMLDPSSIVAYRHEGKYIAVHSTGAFVFDLIEGDFRQLSDTWVAGYTDPKDDSLYVVQGGKVMQFRGGDTAKSLSWRSKQFTAVSSGFSCCRIVADDLSKVELKLFVDSVLVMDKPAGTVKQTFTLPAVRGDKWQFQIGGTSRIESIRLATSKQELK